MRALCYVNAEALDLARRHGDEAARRRYDNLAALLVRPTTDGTRLVGVVGATGPAGRRAATLPPYFVSGIAYPDWTVFDATAPAAAFSAVRAGGFFGHDWSLDAEQSAFR